MLAHTGSCTQAAREWHLTQSAVSQHSGTYGIYGLVDQQLYRENAKDDPAGQGLVGVFRVPGAPGTRCGWQVPPFK